MWFSFAAAEVMAVPETGVVLGSRVRTAPPAVEGSVIRLYQASLNRTYDVAGLNYWMWVYAQGFTLPEIAGFFAASQEYRDQFEGTGSEDFVRTVYRNVLGREGETAGVEYWTRLLEEGTPRQEVLMWMSESTENQVRTGTPPPQRPRRWLASETDEARFVRLFVAAMGRPPEFGESDLYTAKLAGGMDLRDVAQDLMSSTVFQTKYTDTPDAVYRATLHEQALGFRITPEWVAYWDEAWAGASEPQLEMWLTLAESTDLAQRTGTPLNPGSRFSSREIVLPAPATTTSTTTTPTTTTPTTTTPTTSSGLDLDSPVLVVGDSLMVQMATYGGDLGEHPTDYRAISGGGIGQIPQQITEGKPGYEAVIIHTGTNGWDSSVLGPVLVDLENVPVFIVNMYFDPDALPDDYERPWYDATNAGLAALAQEYSHVTLIDWHSVALVNPSWIASDGLHLTGSGTPPSGGVRGLEELIVASIDG